MERAKSCFEHVLVIITGVVTRKKYLQPDSVAVSDEMMMSVSDMDPTDPAVQEYLVRMGATNAGVAWPKVRYGDV